MYEVYLNKKILTNEKNKDLIYVKTKKKYPSSTEILDDFYYLTSVETKNHLTKNKSSDTLNLVVINEKLMPFKSFNSAPENELNQETETQTLNTEQTMTYKSATIEKGMIVAYAYLDHQSIQNKQKRGTLNIFDGYVEGTQNDGLVVSKIHSIILKESDEWFLNTLSEKVDQDSVVEIQVKAKTNGFSYEGKYPPSFWMNPGNKDFEYNIYKKSDFSNNLDDNASTETKNESSSTSSHNTKVKYSVDRSISEENIKKVMEDKILILDTIKNNGSLKQYLDSMSDLGIQEVDAESINNIVTGLYLSIKNGHQ